MSRRDTYGLDDSMDEEENVRNGTGFERNYGKRQDYDSSPSYRSSDDFSAPKRPVTRPTHSSNGRGTSSSGATHRPPRDGHVALSDEEDYADDDFDADDDLFDLDAQKAIQEHEVRTSRPSSASSRPTSAPRDRPLSGARDRPNSASSQRPNSAHAAGDRMATEYQPPTRDHRDTDGDYSSRREYVSPMSAPSRGALRGSGGGSDHRRFSHDDDDDEGVDDIEDDDDVRDNDRRRRVGGGTGGTGTGTRRRVEDDYDDNQRGGGRGDAGDRYRDGGGHHRRSSPRERDEDDHHRRRPSPRDLPRQHPDRNVDHHQQQQQQQQQRSSPPPERRDRYDAGGASAFNELPPETKLHLDVSRWSEQEVRVWLNQNGFSHLRHLFDANDVIGRVLLRLTDAILKDDIGVEGADDRSRLLDEIAVLRRRMHNVGGWSEEDVCAWVASVGFPQYAVAFLSNNVSGHLLLQLNAEQLRSDLGITSVGHRERLLEAVDALVPKEKKGSGKAHSVKPLSVPGTARQTPEEVIRLDQQRVIRMEKDLETLTQRREHAQKLLEQAQARVDECDTQCKSVQHEIDKLKTSIRNRLNGLIEPSHHTKKQVSSAEALCTFKPQISKTSVKMLAESRGNSENADFSFLNRMQNDAKARQHKLEEKRKSQDAEFGEDEAKLRKEVPKFFESQLGWYVKDGIQESDLDNVINDPGSHDLDLSEKQAEKLLASKPWPKALAVYKLFKVHEFMRRMGKDLDVRKVNKKKMKQAEIEQEKNEHLKKCIAFFRATLQTEVIDDAVLDSLLANLPPDIKLSAEDADKVRHATGNKKITSFYKAWHAAVFLDRMESDLKGRGKKKETLESSLTSSLTRPVSATTTRPPVQRPPSARATTPRTRDRGASKPAENKHAATTKPSSDTFVSRMNEDTTHRQKRMQELSAASEGGGAVVSFEDSAGSGGQGEEILVAARPKRADWGEIEI